MPALPSAAAINYNLKGVESLNKIFIDQNGTLRSGWRAGVFLFAYIFCSVVLGTIVQGILYALYSGEKAPTSVFISANALAAFIPAIVIGWLCGKWLEKLPFNAIGAGFSSSWLRNFGFGMAAGGLTLCFAVFVAYIFGGERFELNLANGWQPVLTSIAVSFGVFAVAAAFEEALFRGYMLQTFARSNLAWLAILLTSLFFGAVHADNPNAGIISTLNTVLAGVWFSVAYLKTRDLWFVWGMHLMWNWMQGSLFGIEVSGLTDITANSLLKEIDSGPTWLTGTTYGIEGGIACTIAIMLSILAIQMWRPAKEEVLAAD